MNETRTNGTSLQETQIGIRSDMSVANIRMDAVGALGKKNLKLGGAIQYGRHDPRIVRALTEFRA